VTRIMAAMVSASRWPHVASARGVLHAIPTTCLERATRYRTARAPA
jgi:hypothetical protein